MVASSGASSGARRLRPALVIGLWALAAGCGEDEAPPPAPQAARPTPAATPGAATLAGGKGALTEKVHIEERVGCPIPDRPTDPTSGACDPKAPSCPEHTYCLQLAQGSFCEPCPERDGIRHAFRERDFAGEQNRDPFQSFLLPQLAVGGSSESVPLDPTKKCLRDDQMVATSYSYGDLKLVGIVAMGTQRKALMMGGALGYIIKRGDCVGKEKAVVKDIGTGYITFQIDPGAPAGAPRAPEEYSVQLNPKQLAIAEPTELPTPAPRTVITPVVPPRAVLPPREAPPTAAAGAGSAAAGAASAPVEAPPAAPRRP